MISLEFRDNLVNNRFSYYNEYYYNDMESLNIYYTSEDPEIPFILTGNGTSITNKNLHKIEDGLFEMYYSDYHRQLNGRVLSSAKMKEVIDGARCPIKFRIGSHYYLLGKGFIAHLVDDGNINVLFMATIANGTKPTSLLDVKYYISRDIYLETHKKLHPVLKDFLSIHRGDVFITGDIDRFVGHKIPIPLFKSLSERKRYNDQLIDFCVNKLAKKYPKKSIPPVKTPEEKKKKEAEILGAVRIPDRRAGVSAAVRDMVQEEGVWPENTTLTTSAEGMRAFDAALSAVMSEVLGTVGLPSGTLAEVPTSPTRI